ncbi:hypothetical protein VitviT2T_002688 [Vitis vinifera]|uniref:peroxidase n=1 Tax=Vitis vinifera TaxID=29760 RepID=A0ABY9BJV5_VITVI|nr:hypothetical protein VitviT2T_002688 [Vitis vinifera]
MLCTGNMGNLFFIIIPTICEESNNPFGSWICLEHTTLTSVTSKEALTLSLMGQDQSIRYYQNLVAGKGLFTSDEALFSDPSSQPIVTDFANNPGEFNGAFITVMRRLGRVCVKTGDQGEIRKDCTTFNS